MALASRYLPTPLRPPWHALVAALALLVLLFEFQLVVRQAVRQGELSRRANALLADATWRCKVLREHGLRDACLLQLLGPAQP